MLKVDVALKNAIFRALYSVVYNKDLFIKNIFI